MLRDNVWTMSTKTGLVIAILLLALGFSLAINIQHNMLSRDAMADTASARLPANFQNLFADLAKDLSPAVVHITSEMSAPADQSDSGDEGDQTMPPNPFGFPMPPMQRGPQRPETATGTGVIVRADGYVLTNDHVVAGADKVTVLLSDGRKFNGTVLRDPRTDLALVKIDARGLPFIPFGNSDGVKIGEWVLAVGNPFNLTSTVTAGIVSAKARNINILGSSGAIESFIQTDAAVNPGNSGGALVNMNGELIGVNAAIASNTGSYTGYSFAIPANIVRKVVDDFLSYGTVQRAYLGVVIREVDQELAESKGLDVVNGVYIDDLSDNGGARQAGLQKGDVIQSINQVSTKTTSELLEIIGQHSPGDIVTVKVRRNGKEVDYQVELRNQSGTTDITKKADSEYYSELGANFSQVPSDVKKKLGIDTGMQVTEVKEGMLMRGGVQPGFIVLEINDAEINSVEDIQNAMDNIQGGVIRIEGVYPNGMRMSYGFVL